MNPCDACPANRDCHNSLWNEGGGSTTGDLSSVHTCPTCREPTVWFNVFREETFTAVPNTCPRYVEDPRHSSAIQCHVCRGRLDTIRQAHPRNAEARKALRGIMNDLIKAVGKLQQPDEIRPNQALRDYVEATTPHLPPTPETLINKVMSLTAPVIARSKRLTDQWESWDSEQRILRVAMWAETLHISQTILMSDPDTQAQDLVLSFTSSRNIFGWMDLGQSRQTQIRATWAKELAA